MDGMALSDVGFTRANGLATQSKRLFNDEIDYICSTQPSYQSMRPVQTVRPLSEKFGLNIKSKYRDGEFLQLAEKILDSEKYDGKTILICWHHGKLPQLINALGGEWNECPIDHEGKWYDKVFDCIVTIEHDTFTEGTVTKQFDQQLLYGDTQIKP